MWCTGMYNKIESMLLQYSMKSPCGVSFERACPQTPMHAFHGGDSDQDFIMQSSCMLYSHVCSKVSDIDRYIKIGKHNIRKHEAI